jgi:integrase
MALGLGKAGPTDWVFSQPDGSHLHPPWVTYHFQRLARRADLPAIRLHDGRHTAATMMLEAGNPDAVVSEQLGHRDVRFTASVYQHPRRETHRLAAEAAERLVDAGS